MERWDIAAYMGSVRAVASSDIPWERLAGSDVLLTGATGMIGAFFVDVLMERNRSFGDGIRVHALGRSAERLAARFSRYAGEPSLRLVEADVSRLDPHKLPVADYVLHLASPTHPRAYAADPIGVVTSNIHGLEALLEHAAGVCAGGRCCRVLLASSVEIYGQNRGDVERFSEGDLGYIDCNDARACYTESKRLGEALCQAYRSQRGVQAVVARIARVYGPTLLPTDTKALSQFIGRALAGEDVVLKSDGAQLYSYLHVADAVSGLLWVLLAGTDGGAYNLADPASDVMLRDLATLVARAGGVGVSFAKPSPEEAAGYSRATRALMDGSKSRALGWRAVFDIDRGVADTIAILKAMAR